VLPEDSEIVLVLGNHNFPSGIFFLRLRQLPLELVLSAVAGRDLPKIAIEDG
jgi:hypothetical protein